MSCLILALHAALVWSGSRVCGWDLGETYALSGSTTAANLPLPSGGQLHQRAEPSDHQQYAPSSLAWWCVLPGMGGKDSWHYVGFERHGSWTPWLLCLHDRHRTKAYPPSRSRERCLCFSIPQRPCFLLWGAKAASLINPPTNDPPTPPKLLRLPIHIKRTALFLY